MAKFKSSSSKLPISLSLWSRLTMVYNLRVIKLLTNSIKAIFNISSKNSKRSTLKLKASVIHSLQKSIELYQITRKEEHLDDIVSNSVKLNSQQLTALLDIQIKKYAKKGQYLSSDVIKVLAINGAKLNLLADSLALLNSRQLSKLIAAVPKLCLQIIEALRPLADNNKRAAKHLVHILSTHKYTIEAQLKNSDKEHLYEELASSIKDEVIAKLSTIDTKTSNKAYDRYRRKYNGIAEYKSSLSIIPEKTSTKKRR